MNLGKVINCNESNCNIYLQKGIEREFQVADSLKQSFSTVTHIQSKYTKSRILKKDFTLVLKTWSGQTGKIIAWKTVMEMFNKFSSCPSLFSIRFDVSQQKSTSLLLFLFLCCLIWSMTHWIHVFLQALNNNADLY